MELISMGLDAGMGAIKIWSRGGGLEMLSQVALNGGSHFEGMIGLRSGPRPLMVETQDGEFYVGEYAHDFGKRIENLDFDRLIGSPEMRAMVYGAWTRYIQQHGVFEAPLSIMVGLPLQTMGEDMKEYRKAMKVWLTGIHSWRADGVDYRVQVDRVRNNAQPVGALFDYVVSSEMKYDPDHAYAMLGETAVLSIGFNTLELMVVENQKVKEVLTTGEKLGVRRLLELLNPKGAYSLGELDVKLRNGNLKYKDKIGIWEREVNGAIERNWEHVLPRFDVVLIVGGGAHLLGSRLRLQGKGTVMPNPVLSIANGLYKLDTLKK